MGLADGLTFDGFLGWVLDCDDGDVLLGWGVGVGWVLRGRGWIVLGLVVWQLIGVWLGYWAQRLFQISLVIYWW